MTEYAFETGRLEAEGCKAELYKVKLDFEHIQADAIPSADDPVRITGAAKKIYVKEGVIPEFAQIYFQTTTCNFGVSRAVTIKLNKCRIIGNEFEAVADKRGNVFTLSMED